MHTGLQSLQVGDARNRGVSILEDITHLMNDTRQDPMDVILALIMKCKQDRDVSSIHEYLRGPNRKQTISSAPLNQVLTAQKEPRGGQPSAAGDGGTVRHMCYRNYLGVPCKFGNQCKHIHAEPGSAARRDFERDSTEMQR